MFLPRKTLYFSDIFQKIFGNLNFQHFKYAGRIGSEVDDLLTF